MKKILLIAYDCNPALGSECRIAYLWLKAIAKRFPVHAFVSEAHKEQLSKELIHNVEYHFIPSSLHLRWIARKLGNYNVVIAQFLARAKSELWKLDLSGYSLMHCVTPAGIHSYNDFYKLGLPILIGPLGGGLPTPKGFEKNFSEQKMKVFLRDGWYRLLVAHRGWKAYFEHAEKIIIGTDYLKELLPESARQKCQVIFDAVVDVERFCPPIHREENDKVKLLFAGRLESQKGVLILLEAVKECVKNGLKNFFVIVAGEGALRKKAEFLSISYGLNSIVSFVGNLSEDELLKEYRSSDIFCFPTLREPGGGAILEAMACGLPIITSDYGGPKYSVTSECGIRIPVLNQEQYTRDLSLAIKRLVTDASLRCLMGQMARERVKSDFSLSVLDEKMGNVYSHFGLNC